MATPKLITIDIVYAAPVQQKSISLQITRGTTIGEAIQQSEMLALFPEIDLAKQAVGVFGKLKKLTDIVQPGDRIEIYRPLLIDPKEARRARAKNNI